MTLDNVNEKVRETEDTEIPALAHHLSSCSSMVRESHWSLELPSLIISVHVIFFFSTGK